jgi:hypothetical protein
LTARSREDRGSYMLSGKQGVPNAIFPLMTCKEIPIALVLIATGVALVLVGLVWADRPIWVRVALIVAGSAPVLRVATSIWIRRYAKRS